VTERSGRKMNKVRHQASAETGIDRERIIATLRAHQTELRQRGVSHAALFGSLAPGESKRTSDILIEFDPQVPVGLFEYVGITQYLVDLFPVRLNVANRSSLKPLVRPTTARNAIYAL
jgi:predicted nucleotidyltransferase